MDSLGALPILGQQMPFGSANRRWLPVLDFRPLAKVSADRRVNSGGLGPLGLLAVELPTGERAFLPVVHREDFLTAWELWDALYWWENKPAFMQELIRTGAARRATQVLHSPAPWFALGFLRPRLGFRWGDPQIPGSVTATVKQPQQTSPRSRGRDPVVPFPND
jgi:hypothetical protein